MTAKDFIKKWGVEGWMLLIEDFIRRAPDFPGDCEAAKKIGEVVADLSDVLGVSQELCQSELVARLTKK